MDILSYVLGFNKGKAQGGGGGTTETDIFPLQTVSGFVEDNEMLTESYYAYVPTFEIKEGETYYVEWDGTTYTCKGISASLNDQNYVYLGDGSMLGYEGNGEPFAVIYMVELGATEFVAFDTNTSHDIRVYQKGESGATDIEVKPLTVTKNGTYTAPDGEAYSPITVSVSGGGSVDFSSYKLTEIMPETEYTFGFENSRFPHSPTVTLVEESSDAMKDMIANGQVLSEGSNGIVVWDEKPYAVYAGDRVTPPRISETGQAWAISLEGSVGNAAIPSTIYYGGNLVKPTSGDFANVANAGCSDEPFYIVSNQYFGYILVAKETYGVAGVNTFSFTKQTAQYLEGYYTNGSVSRNIDVNETYVVRWDNEFYTCTPFEGVLSYTVSGTGTSLDGTYEKSVICLGNKKILGQTSTGEPFVYVWGLKTSATSYDVVNLDGNTTSHTTGIYLASELKHTVQIFRFEEAE